MKIKLFGLTLFETVKNSAQTSMPPIGDDAAWREYLGGRGYAVDALTALRVAAVFRCVDLGSKTMATLPLHLFRNTDTGKEKAREHPAYEIVYTLANRYTTAYEFWQMFVANLMLTRGAFAKIVRDGRGRITALWNIPTGNVSEIQTNAISGERYIDVSLPDGKMERLHYGEFLYVPNFRFTDDKKPENPINIAADVLGLTRNLTQYASATFIQGVNPGGFIESPAGLSDDAYARLKDDFNKNYAGTLNAGKFIILEEGSKANVFTRDMEKGQVLDSRRFAVSEVCRLFGIPPHLCMDMEHATFSNIEQQSLEFVRDFVNPMSVRIEQALYRDLLTVPERRTMFFKFNTNGLLRGDTAARTNYYRDARQNGWMSTNDIRELEDMNLISDEDGGNIYAVNGNMIELKNVSLNIPKGAQKV